MHTPKTHPIPTPVGIQTLSSLTQTKALNQIPKLSPKPSSTSTSPLAEKKMLCSSKLQAHDPMLTDTLQPMSCTALTLPCEPQPSSENTYTYPLNNLKPYSTKTSPILSSQQQLTKNVSQSSAPSDASIGPLQPTNQRSLGASQPKLPKAHMEQLTPMDTSLSESILGSYRRSQMNLAKPVFPATSELSLRPGSHSTLTRIYNSLSNTLSPLHSLT